MAVEKASFNTLNAMRGVAAIGVMLFHGDSLLGTQFCPRGYLAVDLFFVLSGFVIGYAYDPRLAAGLEWKAFARIRLVRFYPLYLLGLSIGVVRELALIVTGNSYALGASGLILSLAAALLFLPMPLAQRDHALFSLNIPSWSLMYELIANIAYAAAFPRLTNRRLMAVTGIAGTLLVVLILRAGTADLGAHAADIPAALARTAFSFGVGLLVFRLGMRGLRLPPLLILLVVALCLIVPEQAGIAYDLIFILFISPLLVVLGASAEPSRRMRDGFVWLGIISFPLYAIHRPVLSLAEGVARAAGVPGFWLGALAMAGILAISSLLDRWFDSPIRKAISTRFHARPVRDPAEAAAP
ncbi:MAG: acyltransferase [Shinella sp.]|nr:acyltransferase [Shinella sp.]